MPLPNHLVKVDTPQRAVYGYASVSEINGEPVVDLQGDMIDPVELERAAMEYMLQHRDSGVMHEGQAVGKAFASLVTTPEITKALLGFESDRVGWLLGVQYTDDAVFKKVVAGELPMFSIQGRSEKVEA